MNNQVELLYKILCNPSLRGVGHTTALTQGLKFVGGGTIVMPDIRSAVEHRALGMEYGIDFVGLNNLSRLIGNR